MKPPAFQFYADDFLGGTMTMTLEERGLYITLLCLQWSKGSVTIDDFRRLAPSMAQPSLSHVISKFKKGESGELANARMEEVRRKQDNFRANRSQSGKAGAAQRWHSHSTAIAQPMAKHSSPSPSPSPINTTPKPAAPTGAEIEAIYQAYPRKVGRTKAVSIIRSLLSKNPPSFAPELLCQTVAYASAVALWPAGNDHFIPHPATWFGQGRYLDDPNTWTRQSAPVKRAERSDFKQDDYSKYKRPA